MPTKASSALPSTPNTAVQNDLATRPSHETWTVGEQYVGGIPLYVGDRHFFTVLGPIGSDDFSRAHIAAAAPDMLAALQLDATADKLEIDDPEQSQMAIASFREAAKEARKAAIAKAGAL